MAARSDKLRANALWPISFGVCVSRVKCRPSRTKSVVNTRSHPAGGRTTAQSSPIDLTIDLEAGRAPASLANLLDQTGLARHDCRCENQTRRQTFAEIPGWKMPDPVHPPRSRSKLAACGLLLRSFLRTRSSQCSRRQVARHVTGLLRHLHNGFKQGGCMRQALAASPPNALHRCRQKPPG